MEKQMNKRIAPKPELTEDGVRFAFLHTQALEPSYYEHVIGRRAAHDIAKYDPIVRYAIEGNL